MVSYCFIKCFEHFCIQITYVEQPLKDPTRALGTYGVKDGDVVVLRQADRRPPPTQPAFPGNTFVKSFFLMRTQADQTFKHLFYSRAVQLAARGPNQAYRCAQFVLPMSLFLNET